MLIFLPFLTAAAEGGLILLKWIFKPLFYSFLLPILKFLFRGRSAGNISEAGDLGVNGDVAMPDASTGGYWGELASKIFGLGILGLAGLVLLIAAGWGLYRLCRWLWSRDPGSKEQRNFWERCSLWFALLVFWGNKLFSPLRRASIRSSEQPSEAVRGYRRLLSWGRSCGLARQLDETPQEYGLRLGSYFPAVKDEIGLITGSFSREIYGELPVDEKQRALLKRARQTLCGPLLWLSRLKPRKL